MMEQNGTYWGENGIVWVCPDCGAYLPRENMSHTCCPQLSNELPGSRIVSLEDEKLDQIIELLNELLRRVR